MHKIFSTGILVAVAGCASTPTPPPTLQTGPDAEVTVDGLVRVDHAVVPVAYRKPDMDLSQYTRFMLDSVEVAYQRDPGNRRRSPMGGGGDNFALSPSQMETLKGMFHEAVVEALTKDDGYELTTEPGPDVLRITASLIDLVVRVGAHAIDIDIPFPSQAGALPQHEVGGGKLGGGSEVPFSLLVTDGVGGANGVGTVEAANDLDERPAVG